MSVSEHIQSSIKEMSPGSIFSVADLLGLGSRTAVDQTLYRLVKAGRLTRVARGFYTRASSDHMEAAAVVKAISRRAGEALALTASDSTIRRTLVLTPGRTRSLVVGGHTLEFRRASQRKIALAKSPQGRVLLDLWSRGQQSLTTLEIKQVTGHWEASDLQKFAPLIPAWLQQAVSQSNAPRKSALLGLSGAYDWSNPLIKDSVLIGKVLERHNFEDVVRLCAHYGAAKVRRVFRKTALGPMTKASVSRMLTHIGAAFDQAQKAAHAQA